jgi:uncharacterized protein (TIGR02421 family)
MQTRLGKYQQKLREKIRTLSDALVRAQRPIRILDAIKWDASLEQAFLASHGKCMPTVHNEHYYSQNPLHFDPATKQQEFLSLKQQIHRQIGEHPVALLMQRMCDEYVTVVDLLKARGSKQFYHYSQQLYGGSNDAFYVGAPTVQDLAHVVSSVLKFVHSQPSSYLDQTTYSASEAVNILNQRLASYFQRDSQSNPLVKISNHIIADAAAGAESIKLKRGQRFSERQLRILEVHEGWVHLGTTLNGLQQPICSFLSKATPSNASSQEGLAVLTEMFAFVSHLERVQRITDRVTAINMAENGANFLDLTEFFLSRGAQLREAYARAHRIFRGSTVDGLPFTKDLVYHKGFILTYNYLQKCIEEGKFSRIQLLFVGKTNLSDLNVLEHLLEEGLLVAPQYVPEQFRDAAALSAWMCYSRFLRYIDPR